MSPPRVPLEDRFWTKVVYSDGCWEWNGAHTGSGYGAIQADAPARRVLLAHRIAYEFTVGPVPRHLELDHLCRNRGCVNPAHLEAVTRRENARRRDQATGMGSARTHCPQDHPYDEQNTLLRPLGHRSCITCRRDQDRRRRARLAEERRAA